jgi:hydroxyacylglutathione hydrolase
MLEIIELSDGVALSSYGLEATVILIPGHSKGAIGILTTERDFFCGDLFDNTKQPALGSLIDDRQAALHSAGELSSLGIRTVYPGHGKPFAMEQFFKGAAWRGSSGTKPASFRVCGRYSLLLSKS